MADGDFAPLEVALDNRIWFFRLSGTCCILFGIASLGLIFLNRYAAAHGGHNLQNLLGPSLFCIGIGAGLLLGKKWAACIFIILCAAIGLVIMIGSIVEVPMPFKIVDVVIGSIPLFGSYMGILCWHSLKR